ncbi:ornithine cyclodeaminase [Actinotalea sp.]|uniref:ornithine cyclodeaminase n=1 Tax=Actinotalea sp. TaxID=1872145 RepID=UPI0035619406
MVEFVDVRSITRWAAQEGVEAILAGLVEHLEADVRRWQAFERIPRIASHSPLGVVELMPTSDGETYGFKYVNGHPDNPSTGHQTVTAFGVLADVATGYPVFWSEMTLLTALRTAATSAVVARALARHDSRTMALIGTGAQSEFQALAFRAALGIDTLRIWDTDPAAMAKLVRNLGPLGFSIHVAGSAAEAVDGADVVTTCTADKTNATVLTDAMVAPGMHLNAIGGDCPGKTELDARILHRGSVFVEHTAQTRVEGEIQQVAPDFPVTEIWQVLTGLAPGRTSTEQITIFDSVGFAIEDLSALTFLRRAVSGTAFVQDVDLVAEPSDPKDLFSLVRESVAPVLV